MGPVHRPPHGHLLVTIALTTLAYACDRRTEDDPPLIQLPSGARSSTPTMLAPDVSPPPQVTPPPVTTLHPTPPATATNPVVPPQIEIAITPFTIKIPFPLPTLLPTALPTLPGIFPPVFPTAPPASHQPAPTPPTATATTTKPAAAPVEPQAESRVIVYGTTWCSACRNLKSQLTARNVPFVDIDVENERAMRSPAGSHAAEMPPEMRNGVPVTRVVQTNGVPLWVQGCAPDRIERAYRGT